MSGRLVLNGAALERAIELREVDGWGFERIGREFGVSESGASNAVLIALCPRKGFRPAVRDANGTLLPAEIERLRLMLKKGMKAVDIQLRMGVSAACVAEQRRRYNRDLKERGKALLPPPGNGEAYSGAKVQGVTMKAVEALFMEGFGNKTIAQRTGVSMTHIHRVRVRLVRKLARKGQCLTGCDASGKRIRQADSTRFITVDQRQRLCDLIAEQIPVRRAAKLAGIGLSSAYRIRDGLRAEMEARGDTLAAPKLPGRVTPRASRMLASEGIAPEDIFRFRQLSRELGHDEARMVLAREHAAKRAKPLTFEQQLERVRQGAALVATFRPSRPDPAMTLGGIATAAI